MKRILRAVRNALAALALVVVVAMCTPLVKWWALALAGPWNDPAGDVLVVLGSDSPHSDGIIGEHTYWRTVYAARAWKTGHFTTVIVSGGSGLAESMRDFLRCEGVPDTAIRLEGSSGNTRENALRVAPMLNTLPGRKILLTSDFHMYRARRVFKKLGVDLVPVFIPDALKRTGGPVERWSVFLDLCAESVKIVAYAIRNWI